MLNSGPLNSTSLNSSGATVEPIQAIAAAPTPLAEPSALVAVEVTAITSAPSPIGEPAALAEVSQPPLLAIVTATSPLAEIKAIAEVDWTGLIDPITTRQFYVCILTGAADGLPDLTLRISSWQATVQNDRSSFLQAVVPGVLPLINDIAARPNGEIVLISGTEFQSGQVLQQVMARAPLQNFRYDRGPTNATGTLSGYASTFGEFPPNSQPRQLKNVRSLSSDTGGLRVRSDIDLMLRPGRQALAAGETLEVAFINYTVNGQDAFMTVGERNDG